MRQFLYPHSCLKFDKCDERHCAETTSTSLATQTIALDVPTQEQVVNKNSVILGWGAILVATTKVTNDWSEHAIALLRPPRNGKMRSLSGDIALRAKGCSLSRHQHRVFEAPPPAPPTLETPPLAKWSLSRRPKLPMRPWNNRESQRGERSIQKRLKLRTAVAAAAVQAQPTLEWGWWMCVRFSVEIPMGPRGNLTHVRSKMPVRRK